jgi:hypothetical protein
MSKVVIGGTATRRSKSVWTEKERSTPVDTINDAFLLKIELLGNLEVE